MIDTVPKPDANLAEFLMARARHTSDDHPAAALGFGAIAFILLVALGVALGTIIS